MSSYTLGIDPGQAVDPTALVLLQHDQVRQPVYRVCAVRRLPLGTPYTELLPALASKVHAEPLRGRVKVALDATGVGAPVVDVLRNGLPDVPIYAISITSGLNATGTSKAPHVPKRDLINTTSVILEQRRLRIAANMRDTDALLDELLAYRRTFTERGHDSYDAPSGAHDDLVLALSLALWTAEHKSAPPRPYRSNSKQLIQMRLPSTGDLVAARHRKLWNW